MGAYQYFEFQAIDRPLSAEEMQILRGFSSRARITSTGFVNEYSFGDFKGNADEWMRKYFDAFLHVAEWGTRIFMMRLPTRLFSEAAFRPYCRGKGDYSDPLKVVVLGEHTVVRFCSHEDGRWGHSIQGDGLLTTLLPLRNDLECGDLRALYLAWLRGIQRSSRPEDREPPVPAGLNSLSPALAEFARFLEIDPDLVAAAAATSADLDVREPARDEWRRWIAELPVQEKDEWLLRVLDGDAGHLGTELRRRFEGGMSASGDRPANSNPRSVAELLAAAERKRTERAEAEAQLAAAAKARKDREAALARERHLAALEFRIDPAWNQVADLISERKSTCYAEAAQLLTDLCEIATRRGNASDFDRRLAELRILHERKKAFLDQLVAKGL